MIANTTLAEESDLEWAKGVSMRDHAMVMENFKDMMQMESFDQDLRESVLKPRPVLQIFVSSSMPRQLLKAYAKAETMKLDTPLLTTYVKTLPTFPPPLELKPYSF